MPLTTQALQQLSRDRYEPAGCGRELLDRFVGEQRVLLESQGAMHALEGERRGYERETHRSKPHRRYETARNTNSDCNSPSRRLPSYTEPAASCKRPHEVFAANSSIIQCAEEGWLLPDEPHNRHVIGEQPEKVDGRRTKDFQKRNRHKMRVTIPTQGFEPPPKKKMKTASRKKEKKEGKGEARIPKNRTDILGEQFSANNIANPRITLNPSHKLGIFKKGREAGNPRGAPDLSFNDLSFIRTKPQRSVAAYRELETTDHPPRGPRPRSRIEQVRESSTSTLKLPSHLIGNSSEIPTSTSEVRNPFQSNSDVGPMDSISQIPIRLSSNDQDNRSEYSRLGYQAKHLLRKPASVATTVRTHISNLVSEEVDELPIPCEERRSGGERRAIEITSSDSRSEHIVRVPEKPPLRTSSSVPPRLSEGQSTSPLRQLLRICDRFSQAPAPKTAIGQSLEVHVEPKAIPAATQNEEQATRVPVEREPEDRWRESDGFDQQNYEDSAGVGEGYCMPEDGYQTATYPPQTDAYASYPTDYENQNNGYTAENDDWGPDGRQDEEYGIPEITYKAIYHPLITTASLSALAVHQDDNRQREEPNRGIDSFHDYLTDTRSQGGYDQWNVAEQQDDTMEDGWLQEDDEYTDMPSNDYSQSVVYPADPSSEFFEQLDDGDQKLAGGNDYDPALLNGDGDGARYGYQAGEENYGGIVYGRYLGRNIDGILSGAAFKGFWRPNRLD